MEWCPLFCSCLRLDTRALHTVTTADIKGSSRSGMPCALLLNTDVVRENEGPAMAAEVAEPAEVMEVMEAIVLDGPAAAVIDAEAEAVADAVVDVAENDGPAAAAAADAGVIVADAEAGLRAAAAAAVLMIVPDCRAGDCRCSCRSCCPPPPPPAPPAPPLPPSCSSERFKSSSPPLAHSPLLAEQLAGASDDLLDDDGDDRHDSCDGLLNDGADGSSDSCRRCLACRAMLVSDASTPGVADRTRRRSSGAAVK